MTAALVAVIHAIPLPIRLIAGVVLIPLGVVWLAREEQAEQRGTGT